MADYGSNNDRGYTLLLRVEETGTSTANNTSTVRVQLWLKNGYTTFGMYDCRQVCLSMARRFLGQGDQICILLIVLFT